MKAVFHKQLDAIRGASYGESDTWRRAGRSFSADWKETFCGAQSRSSLSISRCAAENLLKFYIHFSEPMSRGEAYSRIHLLNEEGVEVEDPFLELGEELWDTEQKRFTLFIHPGRIKRGVKPREDSGLPMTEGHQYALRVDQDWKSAEGQVLTESYAKKFRVVGSDEAQPDPVNWKIETPKADSRQPIVLNFNEPLDHAMLKRVLVVRDIQGDAVAGEIEVSEHEKVWKFVPAKAWLRGTYAIEVATNLEDLTGNSIARPFETKMQVDSGDEIAAPTIAIEFSLSSLSRCGLQMDLDHRRRGIGLEWIACLAFISLGIPDAVLGVSWPSIAAELDRPCIGSVGWLPLASAAICLQL